MRTSADVVIVGGGCMGASVAYHLARHGVTNVVLIEREPQLGTMSTGRNAGGFRHQFSHAANIELSKESIALFANFEEAVGTPIDFWPDGYLFLLSSDDSVAAFRRNVAAAAGARRRCRLAHAGTKRRSSRQASPWTAFLRPPSAARRDRRSERRDDGIRARGAGARRGDSCAARRSPASNGPAAAYDT